MTAVLDLLDAYYVPCMKSYRLSYNGRSCLWQTGDAKSMALSLPCCVTRLALRVTGQATRKTIRLQQPCSEPCSILQMTHAMHYDMIRQGFT